MRHLLFGVGLAGLLLGLTGQARADFLYSSSGGVTLINGSQESPDSGGLGTIFEGGSNPINLTPLGVFDGPDSSGVSAGNGLLLPGVAAIWNASTTSQITEVTIMNGTVGAFLGDVLYVSMPQVLQSPNTGNVLVVYRALVNHPISSNTTLGSGGTALSTNPPGIGQPGIELYLNPIDSASGIGYVTLSEPNSGLIATGEIVYMGPDFFVVTLSPTPSAAEPTSLTIAGLGLLGLVSYSLRKRLQPEVG